MIELKVHGDSQPALQANEAVFAVPYKESLVHQVVVAQMANIRAGTKAQKTRSEVNGGGAKPWRQKGTGRARAGTIRSPLWRGGGVTFAAKPRLYEKKINKKMYKGAMRSLLSELCRRDGLLIVDSIKCDTHKTKQLLAELKALDLNHVLIIDSDISKELYLAARNVPNVTVIDALEVNPLLLLKHKQVLVTRVAMKQIEEQLA